MLTPLPEVVVLRLLPAVCRDCGVSSEVQPLNRYLDFKLCSACITARERAMREADSPRRARKVAKAPRKTAKKGVTKKVAPKKAAKPPVARTAAKKAAKKTAGSSPRNAKGRAVDDVKASLAKTARKAAKKDAPPKGKRPPRPKR